MANCWLVFHRVWFSVCVQNKNNDVNETIGAAVPHNHTLPPMQVSKTLR